VVDGSITNVAATSPMQPTIATIRKESSKPPLPPLGRNQASHLIDASTYYKKKIYIMTENRFDQGTTKKGNIKYF
jgi:hypothetical protein